MRYAKLWACSAVALAVIWVFVTLAFAQDKPVTIPAAIPSDIAVIQSEPLSWSFNGVALVQCEKGDFKIPPSGCHLTQGHSLDEFMMALLESEKMRYRDAAACDGDDVAIPKSEHHNLPWYPGRDATHDCVQRHPKVPAAKP